MLTSERVLPLEGGRNFRDLGGYATADGGRVKWGRLYRSGSMARLTVADYDYLSKLGIRVVCDLRTTEERHAEPNKWQEIAQLSYWTRDYTMSFGELRRLMASDLATAEQAKAAMLGVYQQLPFEQAPSYRELFRRLAGGELPLAFNCSAGKDRAGTAAALTLERAVCSSRNRSRGLCAVRQGRRFPSRVRQGGKQIHSWRKKDTTRDRDSHLQLRSRLHACRVHRDRSKASLDRGLSARRAPSHNGRSPCHSAAPA